MKVPTPVTFLDLIIWNIIWCRKYINSQALVRAGFVCRQSIIISSGDRVMVFSFACDGTSSSRKDRCSRPFVRSCRQRLECHEYKTE